MDDGGFDNTLFDSIIIHEFNPPFTDITQNENLVSKSTEGWKICLQWKDGSSSWHPMIDVKNSFPVQLADYAVFNQLQDTTGFSWWVKHTLKKKDSIIKAVHTRYLKRTHKFGLRLPKMVQEAYEIDQETGTDFWRRAMAKIHRRK